jgi:hypothetical protein
MPHPRNINVPMLEGFYKHRHQSLLRALGPGSIIVVFYCPLLSHRWYTVCGVCSSVNNGTLCAYACTSLGRSYMGHCQHFFFGHRQYSWTIMCVGLITLISHFSNFRQMSQLCLGIGTGDPGVFQGYPHPYPRKPVPMPKGMGFGGYRYRFCQNPGVYNLCVGMPPNPTEKPRNSSACVN